MIKLNDLINGCYLKDQFGVFKVKNFDNAVIYSENGKTANSEDGSKHFYPDKKFYETVEGVPLTDEVLECCGFEPYDRHRFALVIDDLQFVIYHNEVTVEFIDDTNQVHSKIEYLHQLQKFISSFSDKNLRYKPLTV